MRLLKRRTDRDRDEDTAAQEPVETLDMLLAEVDGLSAAHRANPSPELDRALLTARHRAALAMLAQPTPEAEYPAADASRFANEAYVPEIQRDGLTPQLVRGAILSHGCLLVRGLVPPGDAVEFRHQIERAFNARDAARAGERVDDGYFEPFDPDPRWDLAPHRFIASAWSGMWVADSPRVAADLFDLLDRAGFLEVATGYLGERPAISVNKSTLRRVLADPDADYSVSHWHQDGAFLGKVRALNIWLSLSRCGDVAPGLDLVPKRIDHIVPAGTEGALFDWSVSKKVVERSARGSGVVRPLFGPGDALLFDELFLHATAASPEMPETRYAVECWFFGPSAFPAEYPPLAS